MEPVFAFICDYADASGGKVNALGIGFDTIFVQNVPAVHRQFYLVAKIKAEKQEAGEKNIQIRLIDADGKDVIRPVQGKLGIPQPKDLTHSSANLIMGFNNVKLQAYGDYALHVLVDGQTLVHMPISVTRAPGQPAVG